MPDLLQLLAKTADTAVETSPGANTNAVATFPGVANYRWCVTGYSMSTGVATTVGLTGTVISGAMVIDKFETPSGLPIDRVVEFARPFLAPIGADVVATLPAAGGGVPGTVVLRGYKVTA